MGINGKVVECENRKTGEKFALKVNPLAKFGHYDDFLQKMTE